MRITIAANTCQAADGCVSKYSLTVGASYEVLEVSVLTNCTRDRRAVFTVIDDDGFPAWVPVVLVVAGPDGRELLFDVPAGWVFELHPEGNGCTVSERAISLSGYQGPGSFWEDFDRCAEEGTRACDILRELLRVHYPESFQRFLKAHGE